MSRRGISSWPPRPRVGEMPLRDILGVLRDAYCRTIGVEYMHISDPQEPAWLQNEMETPRRPFEKPEHTHIMNRPNAAEASETFRPEERREGNDWSTQTA